MFNAYSVDEIIIVRAGIIDGKATDINNEPNPTEDEDVDGYVVWKTKLVRDLAGEEVVSSGHVILAYDGTIDHRDKIKINSVEYPIIMIAPGKDFSNVITTVYFK